MVDASLIQSVIAGAASAGGILAIALKMVFAPLKDIAPLQLRVASLEGEVEGLPKQIEMIRISTEDTAKSVARILGRFEGADDASRSPRRSK